jgi:hypothetical protein
MVSNWVALAANGSSSSSSSSSATSAAGGAAGRIWAWNYEADDEDFFMPVL